jgi:hypothetical protein
MELCPSRSEISIGMFQIMSVVDSMSDAIPSMTLFQNPFSSGSFLMKFLKALALV